MFKVVLTTVGLSYEPYDEVLGEGFRASPKKSDKCDPKPIWVMPGRSTMEAIFLIRQLMEKYREQKKDLHMVFIDLKKAYDKVPRNIMWWALVKHKVLTKYITLIKDIYKDAMTFIRTCGGDTTDFSINIGLIMGRH